MVTVAERVIKPDAGSGVFRVVFLYVGQGDATVMAIPDGGEYRMMLVDSNLDAASGGIDVPLLMQDLLQGADLDYFVNTHPHTDHLEGLKALIDGGTAIANVWHSGHTPKDMGDDYKALMSLADALGDTSAQTLRGTRDEQPLGDVQVNVLAPAEYVCDDIDGETAEARDARIHEHCAVLRFCYGDPAVCVLLTGDADIAAWQNHITDYHGERVQSAVLSAAHHGSRSFFMHNEGDEPYLDHLDAIAPSYVVLSAPTVEESPHDHPHEDAVRLYRDKVGEDGLLHLGENRECVIVNIWPDGQIEVELDAGELADEYGSSDDNGGGDGNRAAKAAFGSMPFVTKIDDKPMGQ